MAKPATVQKLKHGKALCGATFGGFVETFNWLVDFCLNLKGDKDANNANGTITLDRADESAPVIRGPGAGDGSGSGSDGEGEDGEDSQDETVVTSVNSQDGDLNVIGGKGIRVETDGKTIKITADEDKEEEDDDPNAAPEDPCNHDTLSDKNGGVPADAPDAHDDSSDSGEGGGGGGGVPADDLGASHTGDDNCNC